jgi:hypothetical protein
MRLSWAAGCVKVRILDGFTVMHVPDVESSWPESVDLPGRFPPGLVSAHQVSVAVKPFED